MLNREPEPDWGPVVEYVQGELIDADHLGESSDDVRDVLERIGECAPVRHVGLAKRWKVWGDQAKPIRELRNEITEHVAGRWKTVQQEERRRALRSGFTIEDRESVDIRLLIRDRAHR